MDTSLGERFVVVVLTIVVIGSVGSLTYTLVTANPSAATTGLTSSP